MEKGNRLGAANQNRYLRSSLMINPKLSIFPVFVSNKAVLELCEFAYKYLKSYGSKTVENITALQLAYVTTIAYTYRITSVARTVGYGPYVEGFNDLKSISKLLLLPEFLTKYIEAIGTVTTSSGVRIAPFSGQYKDVFPENSLVNLSPAKILEMAGRSIPDGPWAIDYDWIKDCFNSLLTFDCALCSPVKFRLVDYTNITGKNEMLVSVDNFEAIDQKACCPQDITDTEGELGLYYCYRDCKDKKKWLGENHELLTNNFIILPMYTKCVAVIEYLQNNTIKTSKAVFPKSSKFSVFVSNNAVLTLSLFVHDFMQFYNHQINEEITVLQLAYVTTMAYIYRLSLIASNNGYNIKGFSDLKNMCAHLILPDFLAQYIEAIGTVTTSAGVSIVPFTGQYEDIFPENSSVNLSPAKILGMAGRSIPSGPWAIDKDWISAYLDRAIEAHETGMEFRVIDYNSNSDIAGHTVKIKAVYLHNYQSSSIHLFGCSWMFQFYQSCWMLKCLVRRIDNIKKG